jgi:hypothetical protein
MKGEGRCPARHSEKIAEAAPAAVRRDEAMIGAYLGRGPPLPDMLEFRAVDTHYGDLQVVKSVNYRIMAGENVCLLGGNASGKSTTMKAVMGSVVPTSGAPVLEARRLFPRDALREFRNGRLRALQRAPREASPRRKPLGMRITGCDWVDGGITTDEPGTFASELRAIGFDYVCASSGGISPQARPAVAPGYQVPLAAAAKKPAALRYRRPA